jgi:hypothetical protein
MEIAFSRTIPGNAQQHRKIMMLRKLVSSHILKNPKIYQISLLASATEAFPNLSNGNDNAIISRFIDSLKEDGFWGGEVSLNAISNIFKAKISVAQANSPTLVFVPNDGTNFVNIELYYGGDENIKNHYYASLRIFNPTS